ncbi:ester cyclase [Streptomyces sp. MS1.HAVA.3]|uniref:Ester cyclase n=1 Tax=Streptomyces caledonius TaxID=3134107 RepID=A0ABU8U005_9ACTN
MMISTRVSRCWRRTSSPMSPGARPVVRSGELAARARAMWEGFPDLQINVEDMFGADDKVAVRVHFRERTGHLPGSGGDGPAGQLPEHRDLPHRG